MTRPLHIHPSLPVRTPHGVTISLDEDLAHLIPCLWRLGLRTRSSCQDYGTLLAMSGPGLPVGDSRWVDFYSGRVWMEMDAKHAERFVGLLSRDGELRLALSQWGLADSWVCIRPVLPDLVDTRGRTADSAHLFFPRNHLDRVLDVLRDEEPSTTNGPEEWYRSES